MSLKLSKQPKKDMSYAKWNRTTALCYHNKLCCENCSNKQVCDSYVYTVNDYGIKAIQYATIRTLQTIGEHNYKKYL